MLLPAAVAVYSADEGFDYTDFLTALEIYGVHDNMMYEDDTITREEAASILSVFYGVTEESYPAASVAEDVPENWSSGHIKTVLNAGIMNLYNDGLFRPKQFMKTGEVIKMLTVLTGYKVAAENCGGYPTGYLKTAYDVGIVKGTMKADTGAEITKGEFSRLLYNALSVKLFKQTSFGNDNNVFKASREETLLTENLHIYKTDGRLTALPCTSIEYAKAPGRNTIRIDNTEYKCYKDMAEYLGTDIKVYYRQNDDEDIGTVLYAESKSDDAEIVNINSEDIQNVTLTSVTYTENGRTKTAALAKDAVVVFNGMRNTYYKAEQLKPMQGSLKLIDADDNGSYECVIVESYVNYYVSKAELSEGTLYITEKSGKKVIKIDTGDKNVNVSVFDRDRETEPTEIKAGEIISIMTNSVDLTNKEVKDDSVFFKIYRCENRVTGKVSAKHEDKLVIDDIEYKLAGDFDENEYTVKLGETRTFCLNYLGEVSAMTQVQAESKYAVLQKAGTRTAIDTEAEIRIFDETGTFSVLKCADKMKIDGYSKNVYGDVCAYLKKSSVVFGNETGISVPEGGEWQFVKYAADENGEVIGLDTIMPDKEYSEDELEHFGTTVSGKSSTWLETAGCLASDTKRFGLSSNTLIFTVGSDKLNDDGYTIKTLVSFAPGGETVAFFDANKMNVSKAAVWCMSGNAMAVNDGESLNLIIVENIINKVNAHGEAAVFLKGIQLDTGNDMEIEAAEKSAIGLNKIVPGSFVRWNTDANGAASVLENSMTLDGSGIRATAADPSGGFSKAVRFSYGKAAAMDDEFIKLRFYGTAEGKSYDEPWMLDDLKYVYIYDRENKQLKKSSIKALRTIEEYGESEADTIGSYYRWGGLKTLIIYR